MPIFILLTKLAPQSSPSAEARRAMGKEWLQKVKASCPGVKFLAHYAILGPYDFMDIDKAPDPQTAHKVSLISRAGGALSAESWQALPYDRFLELLEEVGKAS